MCRKSKGKSTWNIEDLSFGWMGSLVLILLLLETVFTFSVKWPIPRLTYETGKIHVILIHTVLGAVIIHWEDTDALVSLESG